MDLSFLLDVFAESADAPAMVWRGREFSYRDLSDQCAVARQTLRERAVPAGAVVAVRGDFGPTSTAYLLALLGSDSIIVPVARGVKTVDDLYEIAQVEHVIEIEADRAAVRATGRTVDHPLLVGLRARGHPGLVLFSSGSTGRPKGVVHDFSLLLSKFHRRARALRTISFLLFDHIGGVNTLFHVLSNGGTIVVPDQREPESVCGLIQAWRVELLPTSPAFLNMILLTHAYEKYDLSSLKIISYGTEAMPEQTLQALHQAFPQVELRQTYGLSELGILRSKSRDNASLWMKVGGEDYQTKVVDGMLYIKARCAMLGYLNAPSPFDQDGWLATQDHVEVDGEWLRILGRRTDVINVGGQKVYPAEVESALLEVDNVADVSVRGEPNPLMGQVVAARVRLRSAEPLAELKKRIKTHCRKRMDSYKTPVIIEVVDHLEVSDRFKRVR